jgi:hypothetical protein
MAGCYSHSNLPWTSARLKQGSFPLSVSLLFYHYYYMFAKQKDT